ncbi:MULTISPECIES: triphosphoribosyl-dephospho-CoA synthase [unclassified Duganella]|uniref:triphosphoribosyl-dephospho-CoA synthase n=1 Tax=unclassified Duganella TaxID=2636909 RepID=UPI000E357C07|nr:MULTISPECIES: triphosphoribosyl-dephospho-CoA synthase [unclassified Duganella]RFP09180.1 triphosphoribosyl-dephospho-CoA synthase [Duganella sp. BJB475]RFP25406.1 triphosphoribosyl-dephospho-CoA synthase [Duganella sp. BJB476]
MTVAIAARRSRIADVPACRQARWTSHLADQVVGALIDEATLTPKPGLVDLRGGGAHRDLDWALMCHSAWALHPSFKAMAIAGATIRDPRVLRERVGGLGRHAEATMMNATDGVNTHRGAIWALGLLVTAAAQDRAALGPAEVAARAGAIARHPDKFAPLTTGNKGEHACRKYGVGGARAQAQENFPHVIDIALPALWKARVRGDSENACRLNALLAIIEQLDDTCVLSRGGEDALLAMQAGAQRVLVAGGANCVSGQLAMRQLEDDLLARNVSPGGAADLLAATLFLDRLDVV